MRESAGRSATALREIDLRKLDLNDLDRFEQGFPYPAFEALRREAGVWWHPPSPLAPDPEGFWVVVDHRHTREVSRDPVTYSSERGGGRKGGGTLLEDLPAGAIVGTMLNMSDGENHRRMRSLVSRAFTPRALEGLESKLQERTRRIVDRVTERGDCDFVAEVASELPMQVIADMLGIPQSDRHALFEQALVLIRPVDPRVDPRRRLEAGAAFRAYGEQLIAEKRKRPDDSILSRVIHGFADQPGLAHEEVINFFSLLWAAGSETTRNAIADSMIALSRRPAQVAALRNDPGLWPTAVEELLRFTSPVLYNRRTATQDATLGGQRIEAGDKVTFWYPSANRDASVFDAPDELDLERDPNPHLAFNIGEHVCLGANLARREMRILLGEVLERWTDIELTGPVRYGRSNKHGSIDSVPLRFRRRAA